MSLSFADNYLFYLLPTGAVKPSAPFRKFIFNLKGEWEGTNEQLGGTIRHIHQVKLSLEEVLNSSTRTTRKAVTKDIPEPILPSKEEMRIFYECGRKVRYSTETAGKRKLTGANEVYLCTHCNGYHQGKAPTGITVPLTIMEGRWRTIWRREHNV